MNTAPPFKICATRWTTSRAQHRQSTISPCAGKLAILQGDFQSTVKDERFACPRGNGSQRLSKPPEYNLPRHPGNKRRIHRKGKLIRDEARVRCGGLHAVDSSLEHDFLNP